MPPVAGSSLKTLQIQKRAQLATTAPPLPPATEGTRTATLYRIGSTTESRFERLHSGAFGSTGGASLFLHLPDDLGRSVALAGAVGEFADVVEEFSLVDLYNLAGFQIGYVAGLVL